MDKIININGKLSNVKNADLKKLIGIYNSNYTEGKDVVLELTNPKNYSYLLSNYININTSFLDENDEQVSNFSNLVIKTLEDFNDAPAKVWAILFSYNLYRLYGNKLLTLTSVEISLLVSLYMVFEESYLLPMLDKISDFIFNKELLQELYNMNMSKKDLVHFITNAVESYLEEGIIANIPVSYYLKDELRIRRENMLSVKEEIKLDSIENIYAYLKRQTEPLAAIMIDSKDSNIIERGNKLLSDLNIFEFKMNNISSNHYDICIKSINAIICNQNKSLLDKLELIFNIVDQLSSYAPSTPKK